MIKAVLLDFDGTLTSRDMLDVLCAIVGKQEESERINRYGISSLGKRLHFLRGVTLTQIYAVLDQNTYLRSGAKELVKIFNDKRIITVVHSGNMLPVLVYYQKMLGIHYIIGTQPDLDGDTIVGFPIPMPGFKLRGVQEIVSQLSLKPDDCLAMGDSPADKTIFDYSGVSIAVDPKGGIEKYATYAIGDDLHDAIPIIQKLI